MNVLIEMTRILSLFQTQVVANAILGGSIMMETISHNEQNARLNAMDVQEQQTMTVEHAIRLVDSMPSQAHLPAEETHAQKSTT